MKYKILVVDDNPLFTASAKLALKSFEVTVAGTVTEAEQSLDDDTDLVLLDLVFDEDEPEHAAGMELLPRIVSAWPGLPVVIMTNHPTYEKSVKAIKLGAKDFLLKKNLNWQEWGNRLANYCHDYREIQKLIRKTSNLETKYEDAQLIGESDQIIFIRNKLKDIARSGSDLSLFIQGETGTGKNLAVKYFRDHSVRKSKAYREASLIELSDNLLESELFGHVRGAFTGAITNKTGLFEEANGGILFLDEIGDYNYSTQQKIMRFLENKTVTPVGSTRQRRLDVQLIMATNRDLYRMVNEGKFREDLYYRINRLKIELPPLRERREDIVPLTDYFFRYFSIMEHTNLRSVDQGVYREFEKYPWPGNVRELQSAIIEACTNARMENDTVLTLRHLRREILDFRPGRDISAGTESLRLQKIRLDLQAIDEALGRTYGQKAEAAGLLGLSAEQMRYRIHSNSIEAFDSGRYRFIKKYYKPRS